MLRTMVLLAGPWWERAKMLTRSMMGLAPGDSHRHPGSLSRRCHRLMCEAPGGPHRHPGSSSPRCHRCPKSGILFPQRSQLRHQIRRFHFQSGRQHWCLLKCRLPGCSRLTACWLQQNRIAPYVVAHVAVGHPSSTLLNFDTRALGFFVDHYLLDGGD